MPTTRIALAAGLVLLTSALGVTLSRSPPSVARAANTEEENLGYNEQGLTACQGDELLPAGTTAIRLALGAYTGPVVRIEAMKGSEVVARGERAPGWTGRSVTVKLQQPARRRAQIKLCFGWTLHGAESVSVYGSRTVPAHAARLNDGSAALGRLGVEYLRPGRSSWLTLARSVARRMGLGRAASGAGIALVAIALAGVVLALSSRLLLKELG